MWEIKLKSGKKVEGHFESCCNLHIFRLRTNAHKQAVLTCKARKRGEGILRTENFIWRITLYTWPLGGGSHRG